MSFCAFRKRPSDCRDHRGPLSRLVQFSTISFLSQLQAALVGTRTNNLQNVFISLQRAKVKARYLTSSLRGPVSM